MRQAQFNKEFAGSHYHQDAVLVQIFDAIGYDSRYFVEFGARRPNVLNSAHFRVHCGWCGLLLDGAPGKTINGGSVGFPGVLALLNASSDACARLRPAFITEHTINNVLLQHRVPSSIDLLTIDMDGQDYYVVHALDVQRFRARVIVVEFSSRFTAGERCVTRRDPSYVWNATTKREVGCSLQLLDDLLSCKGYRFVAQVEGEHAIWVLQSELASADIASLVPLPQIVREGRGYGALQAGWTMEDMVCNIAKPQCSQVARAGRRVLADLPARFKLKCADSRRRLPECTQCIDGLTAPNCEIATDAKRVRGALQRGSARRSGKSAMRVAEACQRWPYLSSDELTTRHVITAQWMRSLAPASILDLGAYSNPISNYLLHCPSEVVVVDPCGELVVTAATGQTDAVDVDAWLSAVRPCRVANNRSFVLTVSPATALGFFKTRVMHRYDAVVCLGCDALISKGVRQAMLLGQLERPFDLFLEFPRAYTPSRKQFAVSVDDDPSSAAVWAAAGCTLEKVARLQFQRLNVTESGHAGVADSRVLQHVRCHPAPPMAMPN